mgnify:CR=1 FL=1
MIPIDCNKPVCQLLTSCVGTNCSKFLWQVWNKRRLATRRIQLWYNSVVTALCCQIFDDHVTTGLYQSCSGQACYKLSTSCSTLVVNSGLIRTPLVNCFSTDLLEVVNYTFTCILGCTVYGHNTKHPIILFTSLTLPQLSIQSARTFLNRLVSSCVIPTTKY